LASSAEPFLEASFCETLSLSRRVILQCPIFEAGEKGALLATKKDEMHKSQQKRAKKLAAERALDKYRFFVFGLTIATTLY